jgi:hypothetical protein
MGAVTDILDAQQLHDLWGAGYTITLRPRDPYDALPAGMVPKGVSYQWNPIDPDPRVITPGWTPVPYSRHEGVFAPWGTSGDVQLGGLQLMEKPSEAVLELKRGAIDMARWREEDWAARAAANGITGSVRIATQSKPGELGGDFVREIGGGATVIEANKTIESISAIPREMTPHIKAIFAERDRLEGEVVRKDRTLAPGPIADQFYTAIDVDKGAPWWPTLRAILLPIAVENVRKSLKETPDE